VRQEAVTHTFYRHPRADMAEVDFPESKKLHPAAVRAAAIGDGDAAMKPALATAKTLADPRSACARNLESRVMGHISLKLDVETFRPTLPAFLLDVSCNSPQQSNDLKSFAISDTLFTQATNIPHGLRPYVRGPLGGIMSNTLLKETVSPRAMSRPPAAAGDTRNVSILFADIVGSTRLIRGMDTEDARDLLDDAIGMVKEAVHAFGGSVARVQGDGVMAMFGVMAVIEDHAVRAALAASRIRDRVRALHPDGAGQIRIRVGIHSGPILLRWLDSDFGRVLDAVGHAAHIAAKVEQNCPPNSVAVSGDTLAMIDEPVRSLHLATLSLAETHDQLEVHELLEIEGTTPNRLSVKGQVTHPLVGREGALGQVRALMREVESGKSGAIALVGEAGLGKSRLLHEASQLAEHAGIDVVIVRGRALSSNQPFGALIPVLRHLFSSEDLSFSAALAAALDTDEAETLTSLFLAPEEDSVLPTVLPDERKRLIAAAGGKAILEASRHRPFGLLVDDLQYLDRETLSLVDQLARHISDPNPDQPRDYALGLVVAGRPESLAMIDAMGIAKAPLAALTDSDARQLIAAIIGTDDGDETLVDEIALRAAGLPLAIEEFSAFAANRSDEQGISNGLRLPPRLENLFRARIDQLAEIPAELCALCCALGPAVSLPVLRQVAPLAGAAFEAAFQALVDARILRIDLTGHIQFSHQLFQESGYKGIPRKRREAIHGALYEQLSAAKDDSRLPELELARHAELGNQPALALDHLWRACEEAVALAALETVQDIYHQAQAIAAKLSVEGQAYASRFALLAFDALQQLGYQDEVRSDLIAIVEGKVAFPRDTQVLAQSHLAMMYWIGGELGEASAHGKAALQSGADLTSFPITIYAEFTYAHVEFARGDTHTAVDRLTAIDERLSQRHETSRFGAMISIPAIMARSFASWYASDIGAFDRAEANARSVLTISEKLQHDYSRVLGRMSSGYALLRRGEINEACTVLNEAHRGCVARNFGGLEPMASAWYAMALLEQGKILKAHQILEQSDRRGHATRVRNSCAYYMLEARARLLARSGEGDVALAKAHEARAHADAQGDVVHTLFGGALVAELELEHIGSSPELVTRITNLEAAARNAGLSPLGDRLVRLRENGT
jgi:class 3 adenylate cyclase